MASGLLIVFKDLPIYEKSICNKILSMLLKKLSNQFFKLFPDVRRKFWKTFGVSCSPITYQDTNFQLAVGNLLQNMGTKAKKNG